MKWATLAAIVIIGVITIVAVYHGCDGETVFQAVLAEAGLGGYATAKVLKT